MFRFFARATKENASRIVIGIARNQFRQFNNHQKEKTHSTAPTYTTDSPSRLKPIAYYVNPPGR